MHDVAHQNEAECNLVNFAGPSSKESWSKINTAKLDKLLSLVTMGEENDPFWTGNECLIVF